MNRSRSGLLRATLRQWWLDRILDLPSNELADAWKLTALRRRGFAIGDDAKLGRDLLISGQVRIGPGLRANRNVFIAASLDVPITIGAHCLIGPNTVIRNANHGYRDLDVPMALQPKEALPIVIEDDVWIAANCVILAGAVIRRGAVIAAGAVVTRGEVPAYAIAGGVPARVIGSRTPGAAA